MTTIQDQNHLHNMTNTTQTTAHPQLSTQPDQPFPSLPGIIPPTPSTYDPRITYAMYIPPSLNLNPSPHLPPSTRKLPLIVSIHGNSRNLAASLTSLIPLATSLPNGGAAILAPLFPVGLTPPSQRHQADLADEHGYKFLALPALHPSTNRADSDSNSTARIRCDSALLSILNELSTRYPAIDTDRIYLRGYSGGGQFAHRFYLLHPDRVAAVCIGAPGTVTRLDKDVKWPGGIGRLEEVFGSGVTVDADKLRRVEKVLLVVGGEDRSVPRGIEVVPSRGKEEGRKERDGKKDDAVEDIAAGFLGGLKGRLEALAGLRDDLREVGVDVRFEVVPGVGHDGYYTKILPVVVEFLREAIMDGYSELEG